MLSPPIAPMLAAAVPSIPEDGGWVFEPKWDGFRALVFVDASSVYIQSRNGKDLARYFPELVSALGGHLGPCVLDGEIVVARGSRLDWDALGERIHPAATRIRQLAEATPAEFIAFDLLAQGDTDLTARPHRERRERLVELLGGPPSTSRPRLTPVTEDPLVARRWFEVFEGAGLDGLIGKRADGEYVPGARSMIKVKHRRTADCVVAGLRWHAKAEPGTAVGSLLLGLYDERQALHSVGVVGAFTAARRRELVDELAPLREGAEDDHPWTRADEGRRTPGGINRWNPRIAEWQPLRPEQVVEVAYDHTEGAMPSRFRHTTRFVRWRPDRDPVSCRYDQLTPPVRYDLAAVLDGNVDYDPLTAGSPRSWQSHQGPTGPSKLPGG